MLVILVRSALAAVCPPLAVVCRRGLRPPAAVRGPSPQAPSRYR